VKHKVISADINISFICRWCSFVDQWQRWQYSET